ncbi:MAG TPA: hypothetical protein DCG47_00795 [Spirochaetaceae bacterium]|nr:hypothetical protein [Spirochaetaceae bacterium]
MQRLLYGLSGLCLLGALALAPMARTLFPILSAGPSARARESAGLPASSPMAGARIRFRKAVLALLSCSLGLALGALGSLRMERAAAAGGGFSPSGSAAIHALQGWLLSDGRLSAKGYRLYDVDLYSLSGKDGAALSMRGRLQVYARGGKALPRGSMVIVEPRALTAAELGLALSPRKEERIPLFVGAADIKLEGAAPPLELSRFSLRQSLLARLKMAGAKAGPLLEALIIGVRDDLDAELGQAFRDAGCAHILALSGQHLAILAMLAAAILGPLLGPFRAKAVSCILVAAFVWLVGPSPSVARAALMFWLGAAALALDRPQPAYGIIALAFIVAQALDPESVRTLSFQFSYLAALGIAFYRESYAFLLSRWLPPFLAGGAAAGFAALAFAAPLGLAVFGRLNLAAPLIALAAAPLVAALMYAGLAASAGLAVAQAVAPSLLPALIKASGYACGLVYDLLAGLMALGARAPALVIPAGADGRIHALPAALIVALAGAVVYAMPYVSIRFPSGRPKPHTQPRGLRFSERARRPARAAGLRHAEALRPELPRSRGPAQAYPVASGSGGRQSRMGSRPRRGSHDQGSPIGGVPLEHVRDRPRLRQFRARCLWRRARL